MAEARKPLESWQHHIRRDRGHFLQTWCGRVVDSPEFLFLDVTHAVESLNTGMTAQPCPYCVRKIMEILQKCPGL